MKNDKSLGLSGFSALFKGFLEATGILCTQTNKLWIQRRTTFNNSKTRHITCIPKDNKPQKKLKNWRPLTLLYTIYEIASRTIANRIKLVLNKNISRDQTGLIKRRYIGETHA